MRRRELIRIGVAGLAALGVSKRSSEVAAQPGSGQGPQPPKPPGADAVANLATTTVEDWSEPWIWRPADWPNQSLALNLVGNAHPPRATSTGNRYTPLFSFNGVSPGPTIRVRGNERLRVTLHNHLGPSMGRVPRGAAADPFEVHPDALAAAFCRMQAAVGQPCTEPPPAPVIFEHFHEFYEGSPNDLVDTRCISGHVNVPHGSHTTNLHTHGLHVNPGFNANGTVSDNTFLRVLPRGDAPARSSPSATCGTLASHERIAEAEYEHQLAVASAPGGFDATAQPHPPGTH